MFGQLLSQTLNEFKCYTNKMLMSLPFLNSIINVNYLEKDLFIIDYLWFCALLDRKNYTLTVIDNFEGEFKAVFKKFDKVYILCTKCIVVNDEVSRKMYNLKEFDYFEIYETIILFYSNDLRNLYVYDIQTLTIVYEVENIPFEYISSVFEDPQTDYMKLFISYNDVTSSNKFIVERHDIKTKKIEVFISQWRCKVDSVFILNENSIIHRSGMVSTVFRFGYYYIPTSLDMNSKIIETLYLYGINSLYIRTSNMFYVIHKKHIDSLCTLSLSAIQNLIDNEELSDSMYFGYTAVNPFITETHNMVIYIYNQTLFVANLHKTFEILYIKDIGQLFSICSIQYDNKYSTILLGMHDGDIVLLN